MRKRVRRERHKHQPRNIFFGSVGFSVLVLLASPPSSRGQHNNMLARSGGGGAEPRPYSLSPAPGHGYIAVSV